MTKYKEKILLMIPSMSCQVKIGNLSKEILKKDKTLTSLSLCQKNPCFQCIKMYESDPEKTLWLEHIPAFCLLCWLPGSLTAKLDKNQN